LRVPRNKIYGPVEVHQLVDETQAGSRTSHLDVEPTTFHYEVKVLWESIPPTNTIVRFKVEPPGRQAFRAARWSSLYSKGKLLRPSLFGSRHRGVFERLLKNRLILARDRKLRPVRPVAPNTPGPVCLQAFDVFSPFAHTSLRPGCVRVKPYHLWIVGSRLGRFLDPSPVIPLRTASEQNSCQMSSSYSGLD
jgi:hypothetical protein